VSHIPYTGEVDLAMKEGCKEVLIRMPEWVKEGSGEVVAAVNSDKRTFVWQERYINIGKVKSRDKVKVTFPIDIRKVKVRMGRVDYLVTFKGNTVIDIDPRGKNCPLYQRDYYNNNKTLWIEKERFATDESISW
jgi:DUF1680 family protein